jgi:hypothetical protein
MTLEHLVTTRIGMINVSAVRKVTVTCYASAFVADIAVVCRVDKHGCALSSPSMGYYIAVCCEGESSFSSVCRLRLYSVGFFAAQIGSR